MTQDKLSPKYSGRFRLLLLEVLAFLQIVQSVLDLLLLAISHLVGLMLKIRQKRFLWLFMVMALF